MRLYDFFEKTIGASREEVRHLFLRAIGDLGFSFYAHGKFTHEAFYPLSIEYPEQWSNHYSQNQYYRIDPVVQRGPGLRRPFFWSELPDLTQRQHQFMQEANEAGVRHGLTVPLSDSTGRYFLSIASTENTVDIRARWRGYVLATHAHLCLSAEVTDTIPLSPRESECLLWSARGKSSWEIGMILGISENTVKFHIKNAARKLDANSRVLAIVKAIRRGYILP